MRKHKYLQLLLMITCVMVFYNLYRSRSNIITREGCSQAIHDNQYKIVEESSLKALLRLCSNNSVNLNSFLREKMKTFICNQSPEFLSTSRPLVALASYPGSGNTWTRQLIETATGYYTGSIYTDWNFVGSKECPMRRKIFIVKTHLKSNSSIGHPDCAKMAISQLNFSSAICILRNPYNAIAAEFNRQHAVVNKTKDTHFNAGQGIAPEEIFRTTTWTSFVSREAYKWKDMALYWIQNKNIPAYVLVYEKLFENTILETSHLMTFLNFSVTYNSLYCLSSNENRRFKRIIPKWLTNDYIYNNKLRRIVNKVIDMVEITIGTKRKLTDVLNSYHLPIDDKS
ncbi:sialate:O-sulfotransferase 1-like [Ruditapes philippinarum]|uniref:sialate:O-sulfotransferase 1-like n=1 Tax=Ruditapes philippinarum TaxID=129788 RepID=UPI00295C19AC|nr:sialate:O-sulfotransferase 1-like [Ruditapes philippinarum]XP_060575745.1 sialate:O-sulfotransferase 1-like [Ruditapes philippinarum]